MLRIVQSLIEEGWSEGIQICTGCKGLTQSIREESMEALASWKAIKTVAKCLEICQKNPGRIQVTSQVHRTHTPKEDY